MRDAVPQEEGTAGDHRTPEIVQTEAVTFSIAEVDMKRILLLLIASVVLMATATLAHAQFRQPRRLPQPQIIAGSDIAFRLEGTDGYNKPVGTWLIRLNGDWVEVGTGGGPRPLK